MCCGALGCRQPCPALGAWAGADRFSSGMCSAIMVSGSWQCTAQPNRSLARRVSTCRKWLGIRLHEMGISICISSRGGHCGAGFLRSLRNMAADSGMMFCGQEVCTGQDSQPSPSHHPAPKTSRSPPLHSCLGLPHLCTSTFCFPSSNWMTFWWVGRTKTAGNSFVLGSTWQGRRGQGGEKGELQVVLTQDLII